MADVTGSNNQQQHPIEVPSSSIPQAEAIVNPPPPPPPPPPKDYLPPVEMAGKAHIVSRAATLASIVVSIPVLMAGICLLFMRDDECENFLQLAKLRTTTGFCLIIVFLLSNLVAHYTSRRPFLMTGLLVVMVLLVVMFTFGLALVGVYKTESRGVPASPVWLKHRIRRTDSWDNVKKCIYGTNACADMGSRMLGLNWHQFSMKKLSPIENGCCRPPLICEMEYVNATCWKNVAEGGGAELGLAYQPFLGGDCKAWSNDQTALCYDCQSCKAGFLQTIQHKWKRLGIFLILMSLLKILVHVVRFAAKLMEKHKS